MSKFTGMASLKVWAWSSDPPPTLSAILDTHPPVLSKLSCNPVVLRRAEAPCPVRPRHFGSSLGFEAGAGNQSPSRSPRTMGLPTALACSSREGDEGCRLHLGR